MDGLGIPKGKIRRFGVRLENSNATHPVFNVGPSPDGGLIFTPKAEPARGWLMARATPAPSFGRADFTPSPADVTWVPAAASPKLHYHKSGAVTLKAQRGAYPNVKVQLPPVPKVDGQQIFFFHQNDPLSLPVGTSRPDDGFAVSHDGPPRAVRVYGFLFQFATNQYVRNEFLPGRAWSIIRGDKAYLALDLREFGLDSFLALITRLAFSQMGNPADTQLVGLCGSLAKKSAYVYLMSDGPGQIPMPEILHENHFPKFPEQLASRTRDRRHVVRKGDGTIEYGDFL